jgi:hypothetical protein
MLQRVRKSLFDVISFRRRGIAYHLNELRHTSDAVILRHPVDVDPHAPVTHGGRGLDRADGVEAEVEY